MDLIGSHQVSSFAVNVDSSDSSRKNTLFPGAMAHRDEELSDGVRVPARPFLFDFASLNFEV